MGLIFINTSLELLLGLLLVLWSLYRHLTKHYDYWSERGVPYKKPVFPFGSLKELTLGRAHIGHVYNQVYQKFPKERFCGVIELHQPIFVIRDPDLIKQILIRDFNHFVDRAPFDTNPKEFISDHLFLLDGERWRNMRQKLTPAFSSGKMKTMFLLMVKCSEQLRDCLDKMIGTQKSVDVKDLLAKFTMDIIATCAFGLEINSLLDENTEFYKTGRSIFKPTTKYLINQRIISLFPSMSQFFNVERVGPEIKNMMLDLVSSTVKFREENKVSRGDFLDILIRLRQNKSILDGAEEVIENDISLKPDQKEGLTLHEITAQVFIFFAAGFETASSTMTFSLYELARHQEIQERLWREVDEVLARYGGHITYQALQEMKYMDQVINETLRMYTSLSLLHRRCTQPYKVPGSDLVLEKGQKVYIPIYSLHHDPQYYPDPYQFDPERFTPDNIKTRHPCLHLPFGNGPRNCIGMRFGLMQTKIGLAMLLSRFRVVVAPDTPDPMTILPTSFVTQSKDPVFLKVDRRLGSGVVST